jgi:hypothetical protein
VSRRVPIFQLHFALFTSTITSANIVESALLTMRLMYVSALLVGLVTGRVLQPSAAVNVSSVDDFSIQRKEDLNVNSSRSVVKQSVPLHTLFAPRPKFTAKQRNDIWCKAKSKGMQLTKASIMEEEEASRYLEWPYVKSPWEGDLEEELKTWGYQDDPEIHDRIDFACDFAEWGDMSNAFKDLGWDTRSHNMGGPNHCYHLKHQDGPALLRDANGDFPTTIKDQIYEVGDTKYHVSRLILLDALNLLLTQDDRAPVASQRSALTQRTASYI